MTRCWRSEDGAATLEVMVLGVVLIVPLIWLVAVLADVHRAALAVDAAAREVGWELTHHGSSDTIDEAAAAAFRDQGLDVSRVTVSWDGSGDRGEVVIVRTSYPVSVASFPWIGALSGPTIQVHAVHRVMAPSYGSDP
jgi:Flp pilus assembly protein TadG